MKRQCSKISLRFKKKQCLANCIQVKVEKQAGKAIPSIFTKSCASLIFFYHCFRFSSMTATLRICQQIPEMGVGGEE